MNKAAVQAKQMTGAVMLAEAFRQEKCGPVFTVMGDVNMHWLVEMGRQKGAVVNARDEGAAVAMADGHARVTGQIGVASTTCGPGLTHAATALKAAVHYRTPLVVVAGQQADIDNIQYLDQRRFVKSLGAGVVDSRSADTCMFDACQAFFLARTEQRPVVLNVPPTVFRGIGSPPQPYRASTTLAAAARPAVPDPQAVHEVARLLGIARRPLILVGRGALGPGRGDAIRALAEKVGALVASTLPAYGWNGRADGDLGLSGFFATPAARKLLSSADYILALGTSLHSFTVADNMYAAAKIVLVDRVTTPALTTARQLHLHVQGDASQFVNLLLDEIGPHKPKTWRTPATLAKVRAARTPVVDDIQITDGRVDPRLIVRALDKALPADRLNVTGAGHFWNFGVRHSAPPMHPRLVTHGFGSIGHGLPTAIGAMMASRGRPGLVFEGDSGLLMNIQELDTLRRLDLHLLVVVMNNTALGSEYYKLLSEGMDPSDSVLSDVNFAHVARGFGVRAVTVSKGAGEIPGIVKEFMSTDAPMLVDVKTSLNVVDENYRWW